MMSMTTDSVKATQDVDDKWQMPIRCQFKELKKATSSKDLFPQQKKLAPINKEQTRTKSPPTRCHTHHKKLCPVL